jgi:hypothetical protein
MVADPWEDRLERCFALARGKLASHHVWLALGIDPKGQEVAKEGARLNGVMSRLGWQRPNRDGKLLQDGIKVSAWVRKENPDLCRWVSVSVYQSRGGRTGVTVDGRPVDGPEQEHRRSAGYDGEGAPF